MKKDKLCGIIESKKERVNGMLLGYRINTQDKKMLAEELAKSSRSVHVVSGNPEVLYTGLRNERLKQEFLREDTLIIPDGAGVVLALKWRGKNVQKVAGIELADELLLTAEKTGKSVFLLGATEKVNQLATKRVEKHYPNLSVKGSIDGFYFNEKQVVETIKEAKPDILFVAMGCPRQEEFILKYREELKVPVMMGVGGTFDVWAGNIKRAPEWMIKLSLEWLYRLWCQPQRIGRYKSIFAFMCLSKRMAKKES